MDRQASIMGSLEQERDDAVRSADYAKRREALLNREIARNRGRIAEVERELDIAVDQKRRAIRQCSNMKRRIDALHGVIRRAKELAEDATDESDMKVLIWYLREGQ